jgi:hypothetical protein
MEVAAARCVFGLTLVKRRACGVDAASGVQGLSSDNEERGVWACGDAPAQFVGVTRLFEEEGVAVRSDARARVSKLALDTHDVEALLDDQVAAAFWTSAALVIRFRIRPVRV